MFLVYEKTGKVLVKTNHEVPEELFYAPGVLLD